MRKSVKAWTLVLYGASAVFFIIFASGYVRDASFLGLYDPRVETLRTIKANAEPLAGVCDCIFVDMDFLKTPIDFQAAFRMGVFPMRMETAGDCPCRLVVGGDGGGSAGTGAHVLYKNILVRVGR